MSAAAAPARPSIADLVHAGTPAEVDARIAELVAQEARLLEQIARTRRAIKALDDKHRAQPWTRAFLVNNADGHVHSSTACSTCHITTSFKWVTDLSGATEEQIVDAAGWRACTVCYPTAPVDIADRPSRIQSDEDIERAARAAERAERQQEKAAKGITNPDGTELVVGDRWCKESPKTEIAARRLLGSRIADILWYRDGGADSGHTYEGQWQSDIEALLAALAHKTGEDRAALFAEALKKAKGRVRKMYRQAGVDWDVELAAKAAGF